MPVLLAVAFVLQTEFPVEPGDRLLLQVVEVDVPTGHYRLTVVVSGRLSRQNLV